MPERPLRADAARNRANILRAARTLLAVRGAAVGMDEIAQEAQVAVGTLYRHFPNKSDLVSAIVQELSDSIFGTLDASLARLDAGSDARSELTSFLNRVLELLGQGRVAKSALGNIGFTPDPSVTRRALDGLGRIVDAGHRENVLRPDITVADLILILETLPGDELPEPARHRWLELALRALTVDT